jgi:hypothetical protein
VRTIKIKKPRCTVQIDAKQMEYLRYWKNLHGQPIVDILRTMIAQWVALEYATRTSTKEQAAKGTKKRQQKGPATRKS